MLKAVLFDLDGTLLPMDQITFTKAYFGRLMGRICPFGYTPETFLSAMKKGIVAMTANNGTRTNEAAFWEAFCSVCGEGIRDRQPDFDRFYIEEFDEIASVCGYNPKAAETVHAIKTSGLRVALATNPLFPEIATRKRIRWAGLEPEDFELYTTYETIGTCKPNPDYYRTVLARMKLVPADCLMVGNDVAEDMMAASSVGMKVFLLTDCLINTPNADLNDYPHGSFDELNAFIRRLEAEE